MLLHLIVSIVFYSIDPKMYAIYLPCDVKAFFNTIDWWGICPTGPLPLSHH